MDIRLAQDSEGLNILALFPDADLLNPEDWARVFPYWAIAVKDGEVIAAIQMCPSLPIGRIEHLLTNPNTGKITATKAAHALIKYAEHAMIQMGCSHITGYVAFKTKSIKKLIQRHYGAQVINSGSLLTWRL